MIDAQGFFAMGGYAVYVWGAYAAAAVIIGGLALASWRRLERARRALEDDSQGRRA